MKNRSLISVVAMSLALGLVLSGCGSSGNGNGAGSLPGGAGNGGFGGGTTGGTVGAQGINQSGQMVDITDKAQCQGAAPAGASALGRWTATQATADNKLRLDFSMTIQNNSVIVTNACSVSGQTTLVSITVPSTLTANTLTILNSDHKTASSGGVDCSVSVQAMTVQYSLAGNCFAMTTGGQTVYMVKAPYMNNFFRLLN